MKITAKERFEFLNSHTLQRIDDLPKATGIYALADHTKAIHYVGITAAASFRDRIYQRHVNGSEERSHKLACNYNIGRMWRDRKCAEHVASDAQIAKGVRREFIRRFCLVVCKPLDIPKQGLEALESEIIRIAPADFVSWNGTRKRVNPLPEPRDLVDSVIEELKLSSSAKEALERQAQRFAIYG